MSVFSKGNGVLQELSALFKQASQSLQQAKNLADVERVRVHYLGKKGVITDHLRKLKDCSGEEKKAIGMCLNQGKKALFSLIAEKKTAFEAQQLAHQLRSEQIDITLPGRGFGCGARHPISQVREKILDLFTQKYGFAQAVGPEIETPFYNFTALNMGEHHPARAMHDTFYIKGHKALLRTHTSCVQIRTMMEDSPPFRVVSAGRVFRKDSDPTHTPMFHQLEGFVVDKKSSFVDLKALLVDFMQTFFARQLTFRFRPSYFPFTEPSAEVDIKGHDGWLEVLGCGMIHPNVLIACGIDPQVYQGYAFGCGVDRLAMLWYGIDDLRLLFANEKDFLQQFQDE
jgi:phenylalanyl-tRNA synthetase alpha chain